MPVVDLSRRAFRPSSARVNWQHPLASGLKNFWLFDRASAWDVTGSTPDVALTGMTALVTPYGLGATRGAAGFQGPVTGPYSLTTNFSVVIVYTTLDDRDDNGLYGHGSVNGTRESLQIADGWSEKVWIRLYGDDGVNHFFLQGKQQFGLFRVLVVTFDDQFDARAYMNGLPTHAQASTVAPTPYTQDETAGTTYAGAMSTDGAIYLAGNRFQNLTNGTIAMTALYNRVLSRADAEALTVDPYAMLHGRRPEWVYPAAAAAPAISTPPITTYASGDYTDSGHTWGLTFTATDADTTGADALTYYVRTSATFGGGTQVATGTCTSGASKVITGLAYNASGLVAGPNTLYLHIYDGALNTVTASPLGVNVGAPVAVNVALFSPLMVSAGWFSELAANATAWFDREYFDAPSGTALSPATASLTLSTFAPTVTVTTNYVATPAIATLALTGYAPSAIIGTVITPVTATLSLATFAPTVTLNTIVTPSTATLTLTGYAPALNLTLTPSTASLTLTTFAPSAVVNTTATPSTASLTLATFAPTVILGTVLTPSTASVVTATFAAVVTLNTIVTPAPASLTLTGLAPTLNETITPAAASLALTGFAPDVTVSGGAPVSVTPDTASLTLTGFAPTATVTANIIVTPGTAALTLATFASSAAVTANVTVTPGTASLTLASFTPTATATANYTVTPTTASLTLSTFAPTVAIDTPLTPAPATLVLAAFAPAITLNTIITPGTAALLLVAFAPLVGRFAPAVIHLFARADTNLGLTGRADTNTGLAARNDTNTNLSGKADATMTMAARNDTEIALSGRLD